MLEPPGPVQACNGIALLVSEVVLSLNRSAGLMCHNNTAEESS
jgi:hypothetical protein